MIATIIVFFTTKVGVTHWIRDYSATDNIDVEKFSDDVVMVVVFRQKKVQCLWGLVWNRLDPLVKFFPREMSIWGFYLFTKTITVKLYGRFKNTKYYFLYCCYLWLGPGLLTLTVFPCSVIICLAISCLQLILICIRNRSTNRPLNFILFPSS